MIGPLPDQVPVDAVSVEPSRAVPEIAGGALFARHGRRLAGVAEAVPVRVLLPRVPGARAVVLVVRVSVAVEVGARREVVLILRGLLRIVLERRRRGVPGAEAEHARPVARGEVQVRPVVVALEGLLAVRGDLAVLVRPGVRVAVGLVQPRAHVPRIDAATPVPVDVADGRLHLHVARVGGRVVVAPDGLPVPHARLRGVVVDPVRLEELVLDQRGERPARVVERPLRDDRGELERVVHDAQEVGLVVDPALGRVGLEGVPAVTQPERVPQLVHEGARLHRTAAQGGGQAVLEPAAVADQVVTAPVPERHDEVAGAELRHAAAALLDDLGVPVLYWKSCTNIA